MSLEKRGRMYIFRSVNVSCYECSRHILHMSDENWTKNSDVTNFFKEKGWKKTKDGWICPVCNDLRSQSNLLRIPSLKHA